MTTASTLRRRFRDYFAARGHTVVPSSPLAPLGDPTLLFTTAGMVQFKPYFGLEPDRLPYRRACSVQKCLRLTDLDNVGRTPRHDTFFEMLGNFSFGDYFKRDAIAFAWEFTTKELGLPAERMHVSVFNGEGGIAPPDEEARGFWREVGVRDDHIVALGRADNFWGPAGGTGACGPCSEIYYDLGPEACICGGKCSPGADCPRYMEFWNLVFPQYDAQPDGTMKPLARPGIDTGMGLERLALIVQGADSIFETDLFLPIVREVANLAGIDTLPALGRPDEPRGVALAIIADHVRALSFALAEGIAPSNEGRGYVLRRLLRRASLNGRKLGLTEPFLVRACEIVIEQFDADYPELGESRRRIAGVVGREEANFLRTFDQGLARFDRMAADAQAKGTKVLPGGEVFTLHDTYGFLVDLTEEMARERDLTIDRAAFDRAMTEQRDRARAATSFSKKKTEGGNAGPEWTVLSDEPGSEFVGYETLNSVSPVLRYRIVAPNEAELVLATTPFYAESGGQVADSGTLEGRGKDGKAVVLEMLHVRKEGDDIVHRVRVIEGTLPAEEVRAQVDAVKRAATRRNHTATHLLHAALRRVLGTHVLQAGSLVAPDRLRFDYSHFEAPTAEQLQSVEDDVNRAILANLPVTIELRTLEDARASGAIALFGEKYEDEVRVIRIVDDTHGDLLSAELCGGTHVSRTGDIGLFRIVSDMSIASGTRRMDAVTGQLLVDWSRASDRRVGDVAKALNVRPEDAPARIASLLAELESLRAEREKSERGGLLDAVKSLLARKVEGARGSWVVGTLPAADPQALREAADVVRGGLSSGGAAFASVGNGKVAWIAVLTDDVAKNAGLTAADILKAGGVGGGGKPNLAQGGGKDASDVPGQLRKMAEYLAGRFESAMADTWTG
ncbi:MAG: alanine--tRNA ligase [Candidatus Eiseniibacteriota bacterium]